METGIFDQIMLHLSPITVDAYQEEIRCMELGKEKINQTTFVHFHRRCTANKMHLRQKALGLKKDQLT